jgi:hypothetical protein
LQRPAQFVGQRAASPSHPFSTPQQSFPPLKRHAQPPEQTRNSATTQKPLPFASQAPSPHYSTLAAHGPMHASPTTSPSKSPLSFSDVQRGLKSPAVLPGQTSFGTEFPPLP